MGVEKVKRAVLSKNHTWPNDRGVIQGLYDYNDAGTSLSPLVVLPLTWKKLTNDGLGPQTTNDYCLPYCENIFNTTSNQFDFSDLEIGDTVDIRTALILTTTVNNQSYRLSMFLGVGTAYEYEIPIVSEQSFKSHGEYRLSSMSSIYIGNDLTKNNPAEIRIISDDDATVVIDGWYVRVLALKRR